MVVVVGWEAGGVVMDGAVPTCGGMEASSIGSFWMSVASTVVGFLLSLPSTMVMLIAVIAVAEPNDTNGASQGQRLDSNASLCTINS